MTDERIEIAAQAMFEAGWPTEESRKLALKNNPSTLDGYRKLARAALAALGDGRAVVSVKPLAWSEYPAGGEQAIAAGLGLYRVHANGDDWYLVPDHMGKGGKAAAQADYEARVRSTLVSTPAKASDAEPVAYWVHDFHIARSPVQAQGIGPEATEYLYPANRADHAMDMARILGGECTPLFASPPAQPAPTLPRLKEKMIRAACKGFYGTDNIDGVAMTIAGIDHTFRTAFKRMWAGIRAAEREQEGGDNG